MNALQFLMNPFRASSKHLHPVQPRRFESLLIAGWVTVLASTGCSTSRSHPTARSITEPTMVEAACGQCLLGKKGKGCDLAIRMDGHSYFVDGVNMDALGDAHAKDGMCNVIRRAKVTGEIRNQRFAATSFVMLPVDP